MSILPKPCLFCGGKGNSPLNMHNLVCIHSQLPRLHDRQAVQEVARDLRARDKLLWVTLWSSAGAEGTEVFCSGLVPDAAETQLQIITCGKPPGEASLCGHHGGFFFERSFDWNKNLRSKHSFDKSVIIDFDIFYSVSYGRFFNYIQINLSLLPVCASTACVCSCC